MSEVDQNSIYNPRHSVDGLPKDFKLNQNTEETKDQ